MSQFAVGTLVTNPVGGMLGITAASALLANYDYIPPVTKGAVNFTGEIVKTTAFGSAAIVETAFGIAEGLIEEVNTSTETNTANQDAKYANILEQLDGRLIPGVNFINDPSLEDYIILPKSDVNLSGQSAEIDHQLAS